MSDTFARAMAHVQSGDYAAAAGLFGECIARDEQLVEALGQRAWLYFQTKQYALALADYRALNELIGEHPQTDLIIAECLVELRDVAGAGALLGRCIQCDPTNAQALYLLMQLQNTALSRERLLHELETTPTVNLLNAAIPAQSRYSPAPTNNAACLLLYAVVRNFKPDVVIEIGSNVGHSAIFMAQALRDGGHGHLHCFDLFTDHLPTVLGAEKPQLEVFAEHLRLAGLTDFVTTHPGDSAAQLSAAQLGLQPTDRVFMFVDGDHHLTGVFKDFNALVPYVTRDTILAFHDVSPRGSCWLGAAMLAGTLLDAGQFNCLVLPVADGTGLALFQTRSGSIIGELKPSFSQILIHKFHRLFSR